MINYIKIKGHSKTIVQGQKDQVIKDLTKILKKKLGTSCLYKLNGREAFVELNGFFFI